MNQETPFTQIDPTPFIEVAKTRGHRPKFGKALRVHIGATVDTATDAQLSRWEGSTLSRGLVIDQVTKHAKRTAFRPVRKKR